MLVEKIQENGWLRLKLNRPEVKNAMNPELIQELTQHFLEIKNNPNFRVVLLEAAGSVFSAGADLKYMQSLVDATSSQNLKEAENLRGLFQSVWDCPVPVVCVVQGAAYGGALGLMAASDYVVTEDKAQFSFSEVKLGIAPAIISEYVLRKNVKGLIASWMMSGVVFSAHEAFHAGLVHKVAKEESLQSLVDRYVDSLLAAGPTAVRETKKLIRDLEVTSLDQVKMLTTQLIARLRVSEEGQEGLKSFLEKRKPKWILK